MNSAIYFFGNTQEAREIRKKLRRLDKFPELGH